MPVETTERIVMLYINSKNMGISGLIILKTYLLQVMKVIIYLVSYEQPEFDVQPTTTISQLKKSFETRFAIPMQNFILKYNDQTLEDEMTLAYYNIPDNGKLDIEGNLLATLAPRYVNRNDDPHASRLDDPHASRLEVGRDIKTMLDLLHGQCV